VQALRNGIGSPVVAIRRHLIWTELADDTETLVTAGAENPFLLARPFGQGQVMCLAVSADRSWSDLPLSPYFLPLAHQFVQFAAGMGRFVSCLWATDDLPLGDHLPEATPEATLRNPEGTHVSVRSALVDGATSLHAEGLNRPGIYTLALPTQPEPVPALAINVPRRESDLTPVVAAEVPAILGIDEVILARDQEELLRRIEEHRVGKTFGETLMWLALIVAVAEVAYGNVLVKGHPTLSESLHITAAGKVRGA
jgi:hypothetical protein